MSCPADLTRSTGSPSDTAPTRDPQRPPYVVVDDPDSGWTPASPPSGTNPPVPPATPENPAVRTFTFDELSVLCADIGMSPEMIDGVMAQLLTQHFGNPEDLAFEQLRQYQWLPSQETKIQILPLNHWSEVAASKKPAIVYVDLGQQPQRLAIGDRFYHDSSRPEVEGFARAYTGSHRIMCVGNTDYEASLLATEIERWLTEFAHRLVAELPFHDFQVASRAAPQTFDALGKRVGVALVVQYAYLWTWEVAPEGPRLKSIGVSA